MKRSLLEFRRAFSTGLPLISEMDKRPLVSISNNSFYYYLLSLAHPDFQPHWQQKSAMFKQCNIISPPYWLNTVHPYFHTYDWGHNVLELPHAARVIATDLYPNYPAKKPITWEMYLNIRQQALKFIQEIPNVQLIHDTPLPVKPSSLSSHVLPLLSGNHIQLTTDTFYYNWWRQPALHGLPGIAERSSLELYNAHPNDAPKKVIALGSGLAILWLARHFPHTRFLALKRKIDQFPETPRIRLKDLTNLTTLNVDEIQYSAITPTKLIVKNLKSGEEFEGEFYKAIGFTTFPDTLEVIPNNQKIELNTDLVGKWNAPQVIPEGALLESLMRWHTLTQTIDWVFEPLAYHDDSGFPEVMSKEMRKIGIELKVAFFNALSEIIQNLQDLSDAPNVGEIFLQAFDSQKPTPEEKQRFSNKLNELLHKYHPKPIGAPLESKFWKNTDKTPKRNYSTTGQIEIKNQDPKLELIEKLLEKWWHWSPEGDIRNYLSEPTKTVFRQGNELSKSLEQTPELHRVSKY